MSKIHNRIIDNSLIHACMQDAEIEKRVASLAEIKRYYQHHSDHLPYYYRRYYGDLWRQQSINVPYGVNVTFTDFALFFKDVASQTVTRK